jgi:undecaprenyl-diphosphatase
MDPQGTPALASHPGAKRSTRRWPLVSGFTALVLAVGLGTLIPSQGAGAPLSVDVQWMNAMLENRAPIWNFLARVLNALGGGVVATFVVPVLIIIVLVLMKRPWAAGYYLVATLLTGGTVQLLKHLFARARPETILVSVDFGSFPSGHVATAAAMAAVLTILFPRVWVWVAGAIYTIAMMASRTYLGAHWLTDTIGALFLGISVALVLWAPVAARLDGEHERARSDPQHHGRPSESSENVARFKRFWRNLHEKFIVEDRRLTNADRLRFTGTAFILVGVGALFFGFVLVSVASGGGIAIIDAPLQAWLESGRSEVVTMVMIVLAVLFGPLLLPIIVLIVTVIWGFVAKHAWRPLLLASAMLIGVVLAQIIAPLVARSRPPVESMLFGPDQSFSFPLATFSARRTSS